LSFREMAAIVGISFILIAVYQLATGSLTLHVGRGPWPTPRLSSRGTRLFALGLVSFGSLMAIVAWSPVQLNGPSVWVVVGVLLAASYGFWWSAIRTWKR